MNSVVSVRINVGAPRVQIHKEIQKVVLLVASGLSASENISVNDLQIPEATIQTIFHSGLIWSDSETKANYKEWTLINGFRDLVEALSAFLEEIHKILTLWNLQKLQLTENVANDRIIKVIEGIDEDTNKFKQDGIQKKLDHIINVHGIDIDKYLLDGIRSVNSARNCLVHRSGIVSQNDCDIHGVLKVRWRTFRAFLNNEDGEHELKIGSLVEKGSVLVIRRVDCAKSFALGDTIRFSAQEFADLAWSIAIFSNECTKKIDLYGESNGLISSSI